MSISPHFILSPKIKLYTNYFAGFDDYDPSILKPGIFAWICVVLKEIDFFGGVIKGHECVAPSFWVEIIEIKGNTVTGRVSEPNPHYQVGSIFRFDAQDINAMRGDLQWSIDHLTVLVSENIACHGDDVGYFYEYFMEPWSYNRIIYGRSELLLPKETIPMVEISLSRLIELDPKIYPYLEAPAGEGLIRADDNTFKVFDLPKRDESIFPLHYICTIDNGNLTNFDDPEDEW